MTKSRKPQADHPLLVGLLLIEIWATTFCYKEKHMNNTVAIICSKMQNLKQIFQ